MAKSKAADIPIRQASKFEKKELPEAADLFDGDFVDLAAEVAELNRQRKELDDQIKEKYTVLRAYMEDVNDAESWSARGEGWTVSYVRPKPRETLVKELLIQQGVTMKQIQKATKVTEVNPYVTLRVAGEDE